MNDSSPSVVYVLGLESKEGKRVRWMVAGRGDEVTGEREARGGGQQQVAYSNSDVLGKITQRGFSFSFFFLSE